MIRFLLFFILMIPFFASAQILNIERNRLEKDTAKVFMVKTNAGLSVYNRSAAENAPVNLLGYNFDVNAIYHPNKHAYLFLSKFDYLKINDNDFLNFGFLHGRVNFLRDNRLNYETFLQYSYDNFRGLDPRWILGGAIRHTLIKSNKITLLYGIGGFYEKEKWIHPYTRELVEVDFLKSSNYFNFRATVNAFVDVNVVTYYQVGYDSNIRRARNRWSNSTVLNSKLTDRLSITNTFELAYEDRPIVPITRLIYSFRTGIALNF
jgi:hypothetical protein